MLERVLDRACSVRDASFWWMLVGWNFTVCSLTNRHVLIALVVIPAATASRIVRSRPVSVGPSGSDGPELAPARSDVA